MEKMTKLEWYERCARNGYTLRILKDGTVTGFYMTAETIKDQPDFHMEQRNMMYRAYWQSEDKWHFAPGSKN